MIEQGPEDNDGITNYDVNCDYCSTYTEYSVENWADLIENMKHDGWKIRKIDDEWKHACSKCFDKI